MGAWPCSFMFLALFLVGAAGQGFSPSSNDYPAEAPESGPMSMEVAFRGRGKPWEDLPIANLVVGVKSYPSHFEEREAVRSTWMQTQSLSDPKLNRIKVGEKASMVVRFVVGDTDDPVMADKLQREQDKYHDIVRVPLTQKREDVVQMSGEFLKWAHVTYNYKWAFLTKDDSFVRLDKLLIYLTSLGTEKVYVGKLITDEPVVRMLDSKTPFRTYEPFADTVGYALSHDLADFVVNNFDRLDFPVINSFGAEAIALGNWFSGTTVTPINTDRIHGTDEGCDKDMLVQGKVSPKVMRETFVNLVKGVPCHAHPFRPTKETVAAAQPTFGSDVPALIQMEEGPVISADDAMKGTEEDQKADEESEDDAEDVHDDAFLEKMNAHTDPRTGEISNAVLPKL